MSIFVLFCTILRREELTRNVYLRDHPLSSVRTDIKGNETNLRFQKSQYFVMMGVNGKQCLS